MNKVVLVRLSGELTLKTPGVVSYWLSLLSKNIKTRLYRKGIEVSTSIFESRITVKPKTEISDIYTIASEVARIFGVRESIIAYEVLTNLDDIVEAAKNLVENFSGSFAVRTNRAFKGFPLTSLEVNRIVGEQLLNYNRNLKVDLENPNKVIEIEIRRDVSFVYEKRFPGYGGLPYSVSGKAIVLLSGGVDSSLAAWLALKRGMKIVIVHADMTPYYSDLAKKRFYDVAMWLADWVPSGRLKVYIVPVGEIHASVRLPSNRYRCVFCKMLLLRIAELIADREQAHAIVTGDSLSQVASQTPQNIKIISRATKYPIFRPLIFMDKTEIEHMAQKIGLYEIASKDVGKCKLLPKHPSIDTDEETGSKILHILDTIPISEALRRAEIKKIVVQ